MAGIYFHIPFCRQACHYCDFHFSTQLGFRKEMVRCMVDEIRMQRQYLAGEGIDTIYFGGGTPSLLDADDLADLLGAVSDCFSVNPGAEVTLEANPDDLDQISLEGFLRAGINRLSIGIQSFHDPVLKFLNRAHDAAAAKRSVRLAREAGINNISIDLIYAIPDQSNEIWRSDIQQALELEPEHISAYALTIEGNTVFARRTAQGKLTAATDEKGAEQLEMLMDTLERAGYDQYEVSNFSKPGFQSRHNSSYWKQIPYVGIGPSAHSYNRQSRQYNVRNNHQYMRSIKEGKIPFEIEELTPENRANEYLLTTLRTNWGTDLHRLQEEFDYNVKQSHPELLEQLLKHELAVVRGHFLILTRAGRLLADKITADLFL